MTELVAASGFVARKPAENLVLAVLARVRARTNTQRGNIQERDTPAKTDTTDTTNNINKLERGCVFVWGGSGILPGISCADIISAPARTRARTGRSHGPGG